MAPPTNTILLLALIVVACLVIILVALAIFWLGQKEPAPKGKVRQRRAVVTILGAAVFLSSFFAAIYSDPGTPCCGISLRMRVVDSSGGFTMDDFLVTLDHSPDRYLSVERNNEYVLIDGISSSDILPIRLECSQSPIFWGNSSLTLNSYVSHHFFILTYANSTGDSDMVTLYLNHDDNIHVYHFGFGNEWVDIEVMVSEKQY
jgi:hypothetical protein